MIFALIVGALIISAGAGFYIGVRALVWTIFAWCGNQSGRKVKW